MKTGKIKYPGGYVDMSKIVLGASSFGPFVPQDLSFSLADKYNEAGGRTLIPEGFISPG